MASLADVRNLRAMIKALQDQNKDLKDSIKALEEVIDLKDKEIRSLHYTMRKTVTKIQKLVTVKTAEPNPKAMLTRLTNKLTEAEAKALIEDENTDLTLLFPSPTEDEVRQPLPW